MIGTVLQVFDAGSFLLVTVDGGPDGGIVDVPVDPRCMADLIAGSALLNPRDLEGRRVEVGDGGATLRVLEPYE